MSELPRPLPEFETRFAGGVTHARRLLWKRWPDGFRCPACGHDEGWEPGRARPILRCAARERQVPVTAGAVPHGSHLGLRTWFPAACLVATHENGMSARQLWRQLGLGSYKPAWLLLPKLRRAMVDPDRGRSPARSRSTRPACPFAPRARRHGRGARTGANSSSPGLSGSKARSRGGPGPR